MEAKCKIFPVVISEKSSKCLGNSGILQHPSRDSIQRDQSGIAQSRRVPHPDAVQQFSRSLSRYTEQPFTTSSQARQSPSQWRRGLTDKREPVRDRTWAGSLSRSRRADLGQGGTRESPLPPQHEIRIADAKTAADARCGCPKHAQP